MILFDSSIRGWIARGYVRKGLNERVAARMADLQKQIDDDMTRLSTVPEYYRKNLQERIDRNIVELKRVSKSFHI